MNAAQLFALASLRLQRRLYLASMAVAKATGIHPESLAVDVCDLAIEAGVLLDV